MSLQALGTPISSSTADAMAITATGSSWPLCWMNATPISSSARLSSKSALTISMNEFSTSTVGGARKNGGNGLKTAGMSTMSNRTGTPVSGGADGLVAGAVVAGGSVRGG